MKYNPHLSTINKSVSNYKIYRNTSSNYLKKVRAYILKRDNYKCKNCGSVDDLQVDHIISVYKGFNEKISIKEINSLNNLQLLCSACNSSKNPER